MDDKRHYHKVVNKIAKLINSGTFPPGSRLPSERDLAKKFGVCRVSVRQAQIVLQAQGRLKVKERSGVYVLSKSEVNLDDYPKVGPFELLQARTLFEIRSVALAAPIIKDEALLELEEHIAIMTGKKNSNMTPVEVDAAFHHVIARSTNNPVITLMMNTIWKMWSDIPQLKTVHEKMCNRSSHYFESEHIAIFRALKNRDSAAAGKAAGVHFARISEVLLAVSEEEAYQNVKRKAVENRMRFLLLEKII